MFVIGAQFKFTFLLISFIMGASVWGIDTASSYNGIVQYHLCQEPVKMIPRNLQKKTSLRRLE